MQEDLLGFFVVEAPDGIDLSQWEWVEERTTHREFLVPASVVNHWPRRLLSEAELYELLDGM
jgi:hypothetical protein